jgi:hypothetical protein
MEANSARPHIGRIYDYMLGGHHNFEVDRQAAAHLMGLVPSYPKWARLNRWFLQLVAEQWSAEGRTRVLDIGTGLPTEGHLHECMPGARILYSDNDPISVEYGRQLLEGVPNVIYAQADAREPQQLLDAASAFFGAERQIAVGCIGMSYLLDDATLAALAQRLHEWCAPGSVMGLTFLQIKDSSEGRELYQELLRRLEKLGAMVYSRTPEQLAALMAPWRMGEPRELASWLHVEESLTAEDRHGDVLNASGVLLQH